MRMNVCDKICYIFYTLVAVTLQLFPFSESGLNCNKAYYGSYGHKGVISSYNFPFDYRDNLTCVNRIFIPPPIANESRKICFVFKSFFMETSSPYCSFDSLTIGQTTKNKYCRHGVWQYGLIDGSKPLSFVWFNDFCWKIESGMTFDLIFSSDNTVNGTGFLAFYEVFSSTSPDYSSVSTPVSGYAPCRQDEWVCVSDRKCILAKHCCDGRNDCTDGSDETFAFARCKEQQNLTSCDFSNDGVAPYNFCHLTQEGWELVSSLDSALADHTNGSHGYYIRTTRIPAKLMGRQMDLHPNTSYCLRFWYFLSGNLSGLTLSAYLTYDQAYFQPEWFINPDTMPAYRADQYKIRNKQARPSADWDGSGWRVAEIVVDLKSKPLKFILAARKQDPHIPLSSQASDLDFVHLSEDKSWMKHSGAEVAIDDISLLEGPCSGVDMQCNFESSTCGWVSDSTSLQHFSGQTRPGYVWKLRTSQHPTDIHFDRSSFDGSGNFAFIFFPTSSSSSEEEEDEEERGSFISPPISAFPNDELCFAFWYQKRFQTSCQLKVLTISYDGHLSRDLWTDKVSDDGADESDEGGDDGFKDWKQVKVNITSNGPFKIVLHAVRNDVFESCLIAVDKIRVDRQLCKHKSCMLNEFQCSDRSCIPLEMRCDGKLDCDDESDEDASTCSSDPSDAKTHSALADQAPAKCIQNESILCDNNTLCIPKSWLCDDVGDCLDSSDEAGCGSFKYNAPPFPLPPGDQNSEQSIPDVEEEEEDEDAEEDGDECSDHDFHCASGDECVSSASLCDGSPDCSDQSDENNCTAAQEFSYPGCPPKFLPCVVDEDCVTPSMFCDGKPDCPDSSDELEINCIRRADSGSRTALVIVGAVCAVILVLFISVIVVVCFVVAKRRQKRCHTRRRPNLPPPTMTSIATIFNSPDSQNHTSQGYRANQQQAPLRNNVVYNEESVRFPTEDVPPPYNPVVQQLNYVSDLKVSASFDKLDFNPEERDGGSTGNFIPDEVPFHAQLVHAMPTKSGGTLKRREPSSKDRMTSTGDHIYEEPSGLVALMKNNLPQPQGSRLSPGPSNRLLIPMQQSRNARSSIVSPTASSATCQRVSRIRLGTTSLHPRAGSVEGGWASGNGAFENRGHATMGRPTRSHQHNSVMAGRRRSGGIDIERPPSSPTTPPPYFGDNFASDLNKVVGSGMEEMMMRVGSKSSTPADSSNSSNSGSSNTRLLPSSASCQQFLTTTNSQLHAHGRKNQKLTSSGKQNQVDRIPLGICYSSDQQFHDMFPHQFDRHHPQLRNQKLSSAPSPHANSFQQRHLLSGLGDSFNMGGLRGSSNNKPGNLLNGTAAKSRLKQDSFEEATPSSPLLQHHVICGDEFLNPTCV